MLASITGLSASRSFCVTGRIWHPKSIESAIDFAPLRRFWSGVSDSFQSVFSLNFFKELTISYFFLIKEKSCFGSHMLRFLKHRHISIFSVPTSSLIIMNLRNSRYMAQSIFYLFYPISVNV